MIIGKLMGRVFLREPYNGTIDSNHMAIVVEGVPGGGKSEILHALGTISKGFNWMKNNKSSFQSLDILHASWIGI